MLSLKPRKDRCKKCKKERALRLCPLTNKGLCWKCCNAIRVNMKCPVSCPYAGKIDSSDTFPTFRSDNNSEYNQINQSYIDIWINKPIADWEGLSPAQLREKDKAALLKELSKYQYPGNFPVAYLMSRLNLDTEQIEAPKSPDDVVSLYLDEIIAFDFDKLNSHTMNRLEHDDIQSRYAKIMKKNPYFKKLKQYSFIHSGLAEDASQAIVFVELNLNQEYTFILRNDDNIWYIRQGIVGNPSLYFKQNETYAIIANHLSENKLEDAYYEISEALRSYPDSADLYYYRALYWGLVNEKEKAKQDLLNSIALENSFASPYMNLGLLYLIDKDYDEALFWFNELSKLEPDNLDAQNNLAIAHLAKENKDEAMKIWRDLNDKHPAYQPAKQNLELYG